MNTLRKAQFEFDNRMPPPVNDEDPEEAEWIETNAVHLMVGYRIEWGYNKADRGEVTQADYYRALQDHANQRQKDGEDKVDAFGQLLAIASNFGSGGQMYDLAVYLLGSKTIRKEIAVSLLKPHAARAIALQKDQDDLERMVGF